MVKRPGAFTKKAEAAGMSVQQYANKVLRKDSKADTRTKKEAVLAKTFASFHHKKGTHHSAPNGSFLDSRRAKFGVKE